MPQRERDLFAMTGEDADSANPPEIADLRVRREIGRGATGVVYEALDPKGRQVALKVLHAFAPGSADRESAFLQRPLPCVPRLIDEGWTADGRRYLATEFIDGRPIDEACATWSLAERVDLLIAVSDAVHSMHSHGIMHRDLKPSNILVDATGSPWIIDLGIAGFLERSVSLTLTGDLVGTPGFMAPEQIRGDRNDVTTQADIHALGAIGYLVLTGSLPHDASGTPFDVADRMLRESPRDPRRLEPSLPKPLGRILLKACAPQPSQRYESASALAKDLGRWCDGDPVEAGRPPLLDRLSRASIRHRRVTIGVIVLMTTIVSVAASFASITHVRTHVILLDHDPSSDTLVIRPLMGGAQTQLDRVTLFTRPSRGDSLASYFVMNRDDVVAACATNDPTRPLWTIPTDEAALEIPPPVEEFQQYHVEGLYRCYGLWSFDIFPEPRVSHDEIIVSLRHFTHSKSVVLIVDRNGTILRRFWHDGQIDAAVYDPVLDLLVLGGCNSEVAASKRFGNGQTDHPRIVFAVRPGDLPSNGWIRTPTLDGSIEPAWYRTLHPFDRAGEFKSLSLGITAREFEHTVTLWAYTTPDSACSWSVGPDGPIGAGVPNDVFASNHITTFHWGVLPDLIPDAE